jgi:hypothetical protein
MIIKIEMLLEIDNDFMSNVYRGDPRNWPQIILNEIQHSDVINEGDIKIIIAEATEISK